MIKRESLLQFIRFGVVGLASNAVLYIAYLAITAHGVEPKIAMSLLYAVGVLQTFLFNKRWSFRHDGPDRSALLRYCMAYALGYLLNLLVLIVMVDGLGAPHQPVQGVMVLVLAMFLFLLQRHWVFSSRASPS